jgi:regulator of replication initiation timing
MKAKLDVDIPDELIDQKVKTLTRENTRLKNENLKLKDEIKAKTIISERATRIIEAIREAGGFCDDGCYGDH